MIVVHIFTPNEGSKTKDYFLDNIQLIFVLVAIFVGSHFFYSFDEPSVHKISRFLLIGLLLATAYFKKQWMMYLIAAFWLFGLLSRGSLMVA
jgi:hypothetical protein